EMAQALGIEPIAGAGGTAGRERFGTLVIAQCFEQIGAVDAEIVEAVIVALEKIGERHAPGLSGSRFGEPGEDCTNRIV
ncbi:hypothetical protein, partial [Devosia sp.]|uniref:hypothetical protein n=1 Tax=Devosia sp. TaxID=1871048 RepID=UPI00260DC526